MGWKMDCRGEKLEVVGKPLKTISVILGWGRGGAGAGGGSYGRRYGGRTDSIYCGRRGGRVGQLGEWQGRRAIELPSCVSQTIVQCTGHCSARAGRRGVPCCALQFKRTLKNVADSRQDKEGAWKPWLMRSRLKKRKLLVWRAHTHKAREEVRAAFVYLKTGQLKRYCACLQGKTLAKSKLELKAKAHLAPYRGEISHM